MFPLPVVYKCQVAWAMKFCTVAPNMCVSLVWNLLHVPFFRCLEFWGGVCILGKFMYSCIWLTQVSEKFPWSWTRRVLHCAGTGQVSRLEHFRWQTRTLPSNPSALHLRTVGVVLYTCMHCDFHSNLHRMSGVHKFLKNLGPTGVAWSKVHTWEPTFLCVKKKKRRRWYWKHYGHRRKFSRPG